MIPKDKRVIIIAGPTAVGKTSVAIQLAKHFNTEIISADSRQCYKELNIGVARPSPKELAEVPHHFIATHSIHEEVTAAAFEEYGLSKAMEIFQSHDHLIMCGGTGLYIKAFCDGLDQIPAVDPSIRNRIIEQYEKEGLTWLQDQLANKDPQFFRQGEIQNPQRSMRALEVMEATGKSILDFHGKQHTERDFSISIIGLTLPKEQLHRNINNRVDKMIEAGLVEEVKSLLPFRHVNALQTVGYSEIFEYLDNNLTLEQAIEKIKTNTRRYAKRQMTWFRKDTRIQWFSPIEVDEIIKHF